MSTKGPNDNPDRDGDLAVQEKQTTRRARPYNVVFHNDDYTTMEFVIHVLMQFFHKAETEATQIMLEVHHRGYGVVGVFTRDIAETKAEQVSEYAKKHGHPLRVTAEPAEDPEDES
ncbi:MAG: ATP-dependent Clp protease adapter ClpS [Polyangiaceae bacterium]|nr:ATP-dependent Clp protease adapter ClpS [Polyangiaceae bacterium]MBK8998307.1 ATP-dependent Clp protease adapter ClpS [Myxococcales bacterium]MCE7888956.1 ATP-dependent Clp protease adapter ClpS [Sorangiineae bacterium PRO1]MCL4748808.1 ATP-dependent Clp protease adapter ClpS [Myxococcales bacterium]